MAIMSWAQMNLGHTIWLVVAEISAFSVAGKLSCTNLRQSKYLLIICREILSLFIMGVSHSAYSKVSSIQEGHTRVATAINAGFATYLT